ncbi:MAG: transcriptional repressor LexA [Deltaproteobacteria bacterium]|nr:transcriptional repressor LexA [Deltaproteobacteria bacterium]
MLTKRQKELVDYLDGYITKRGYAPTLEEIGQHFGLSSLATIHKHLTNLEKKGLIRRKWNRSRALEVVPRERRAAAIELPLLGRVAAGAPIEALEQPDTIAVPEELVGRGKTFVLRVRGNSMVKEGILDGDYIVVESRSHADNGDTVVALVKGDATVKRFYREKAGMVRLQPANDQMEPIIARAADVEIRGIVVAVMRKYLPARKRPAA